MKQGTIRWGVYLVALFALGPVAGALAAVLRAADGGGGATPLVSTAPLLGVGIALAVFVLALVPGVVSAVLIDSKAGAIASGFVLAWPAYRSGTVDGLMRSAGSGGVLGWLGVEGVLVGVLMVLLCTVLHAAGKLGAARRKQPLAHDEPEGGFVASLVGKDALPVLGGGVIAGAIGGWAIAQTPLSGQAVAAGLASGVAAGAIGHLIDHRVTLPTLAMVIGVLAAAGPLTGFFTPGDLLIAGRAGDLFPLANIPPLHWAAGGLMGLPLGMAWAGSMLEKKGEPKPA